MSDINNTHDNGETPPQVDPGNAPLMPHGYDGIYEYDNPIPLWLTIVFVCCVVFSVVYIPYYHVFDAAPLPRGEYELEMQEANAQKAARAAIAEKERAAEVASAKPVAGDPAQGEEVYGTYCASCHGAALEGLIGPNLADDQFIHGNTVDALRGVINQGVADKGMPAWNAVLGDERIGHVLAFLKSKNEAIVDGAVSGAASGDAASATGSNTAAAAPAGDAGNGANVYTTYCASCHGAQLEGLIGPNLKDDVWIHGNDVATINGVVNNGVAEKGMPAWGAVLGDARINDVIAYLQTQNATIGAGQ